MNKKFYRSTSNRILNGTLGGLGEYLSIDPNLVRIVFLFIFFFSHKKFIIALMYLIVPLFVGESSNSDDSDSLLYETNYPTESKSQTKTYLSVGLILIGAFLLLDKFSYRFSNIIHRAYEYWPILLIVLGIYIIAKRD